MSVQSERRFKLGSLVKLMTAMVVLDFVDDLSQPHVLNHRQMYSMTHDMGKRSINHI